MKRQYVLNIYNYNKMDELVKINNDNNNNVSNISKGERDLNLFKQQVKVFSDTTGKSETFISDAVLQSKAINLDPMGITNNFWCIPTANGDKAMMKASVLHSLLVNREIITEPLDIVKNAEIRYYYVHKDYYIKVKEYFKEWRNKALETFKGTKEDRTLYIKNFNGYIKKILSSNLCKHQINDDYVKTEIPIELCYIHSKIGIIPLHDRESKVTGTLYLKGLDAKGNRRLKTIEATIQLNSMFEQGVITNSSPDKNNVYILKGSWINIEKMMFFHVLRQLIVTNGIDPSFVPLIETEVGYTQNIPVDDIIITSTK